MSTFKVNDRVHRRDDPKNTGVIVGLVPADRPVIAHVRWYHRLAAIGTAPVSDLELDGSKK